MPGIRDNGLWKPLREIYIKNSSWKEVKEIYQKYNGSWRLIWEPSAKFLIDGTSNEVNLNDGSYIVSGLNDITITAVGDFEAEVVMWGGGSDDATGGYSYGTVSFKKNVKYRIVTGYGGGLANPSYPSSSKGGGFAGLFEGSQTGVSINQTQALMIAGGAGGGGTSTYVGGGGGGLQGNNGTNSPSGAGGAGATQSSGPGGQFKGQDYTYENIGGDQVFYGPGTWTCPPGVTKISILCIGAGGGGSSGANYVGTYNAGYGGGGGGLSYKNNVSVTSGEILTIQAGYGGSGGNGPTSDGIRGGDSYAKRQNGTSLCYATGGGPGQWSSSGYSGGSPGYGGSKAVGDGGGTGGTGGSGGSAGSSCGGGGGAGGYSGNGGGGGSGFSGSSGTGGAGGGGGGGYSSGGWGGGGTGVYGSGSNGSGGSTVGGGGSGGNPGVTSKYNNLSTNGSAGGFPGGGGGAAANNGGFDGGRGGGGAVRIVWGAGVSYPNNAPQLFEVHSGGGAGYYGGGSGIYTASVASGSGGGSGFLSTKVLSPKSTATFSGSSDPDRGTAGNTNYGPARVVIRLLE